MENIYIIKQLPIKYESEVKAFYLCDNPKNIKVGDELTCIDGKKATLTKKEQLSQINHERWFKIIGLISEDATWINNDDVIKTDDVDIPTEAMQEGMAKLMGKKLQIRILCPHCKRFSNWN